MTANLNDSIVERPGMVIGPYELLERIGEGAVGAVFKAEQICPVRRKVALKVLKRANETPELIARFEAERQALAIMDHPNIVKIFDAGTATSGRPFFVMELLDGLPITDYCGQKHLEPHERLELFLQLCRAVQHAHEKGVMHRDLKPADILVASYAGKPTAKLIDFGVAKALYGRVTQNTSFISSVSMIGTPPYMSPEQACRSPNVDARSDIYSLGVLLLELLTGTAPFAKDPFKQTPPAQMSGLARGGLDRIAMKCLEKDPSRRYDTADALVRDIKLCFLS